MGRITAGHPRYWETEMGCGGHMHSLQCTHAGTRVCASPHGHGAGELKGSRSAPKMGFFLVGKWGGGGWVGSGVRSLLLSPGPRW